MRASLGSVRIFLIDVLIPRRMHMTPDDSYETPFPTDSETDTGSKPESSASENLAHPEDVAEADAAEDAWNNSESNTEAESSDQDESHLAELAQPFVGLWNSLISTTNWEKGRIISQWREALVESGVDSHQYSDEAWARRVGGVTAPHVGRLRRVHDRFASTYETYSGLYWSHFLAALDWDDAPMWLEGAAGESWSVSQMRNKRWEAEGAVESHVEDDHVPVLGEETPPPPLVLPVVLVYPAPRHPSPYSDSAEHTQTYVPGVLRSSVSVPCVRTEESHVTHTCAPGV